MTILQSKTSQKGDSDDPPPKKKAKKSKNCIRSQVQPHVVSHATTSSAPGPSNRRPEQRELYSPYFVPPEPEQSRFFDSDRVIHEFQLDKFDVGIAPRSPAPAPEYEAAGPSHVVKSQHCNPACLEYYVYNRWGKTKAPRTAPKRPLPDVDLIEVISSEDIVGESLPREPVTVSDGVSLLDDINNFDFDDKFGEIEKFQQDAIWEDSKMHPVEKTHDEVASLLVPPMNGYDKHSSADAPFGIRSVRSSHAASLSNLGNTCFLNSVLYTLRFAPNFLHNLHHLVSEMNVHSPPDIAAKRTASLGRNLSLMTSKKKEKEVSSGAGDLTATVKTKKQIVTEKLHGVYEAMRAAEAKDHSEPFHPEVFLTALREVNPIFEGNQQQDAHELLVCLLDIFRETCQASVRQAETRAAFDANAQASTLMGGAGDKANQKKIHRVWHSSKLALMSALERKNKKNTALNLPSPRKMDRPDDAIAAASQDVEMPMGIAAMDAPLEAPHNPLCLPPRLDNFVAQDFEGVMVLRTTCLECENTTEKNEPFADICVPIKTEYNDDNDDDSSSQGMLQNPSELYQRAVVTDEFLRDRNKYYCEECHRYNEARRSVSYQRLPRLLTLQLKRFSSTFGAMSKVTRYMPTPMTLACFCEECVGRKELGGARHGYELYGVIMHLGPNMAGGHYIAYVRMSDSAPAYRHCPRARVTDQAHTKPMLRLFKGGGAGGLDPPNGLTAPRPTCRALDCCAARLPEPELHGLSKYEPASPWMACDDDIVKVLSAEEVETLLSKNSTSNATPYLLFYARRTE